MGVTVGPTNVTLNAPASSYFNVYSPVLPTPPAGVARMRFAYRAYWDAVSATLPASWTSSFSDSPDIRHKKIDCIWNNCISLGLGFTNDIPYLDTGDSNGFFPNKGFFGWYTGASTGLFASPYNEYEACGIVYSARVLGNVSAWAHFGRTFGNISRKLCPFATKQIVSGGTGEASIVDGVFSLSAYTSGDFVAVPSFTDMSMLGKYPANPTEGVKCTHGWEIVASQTDFSVYFQHYINTNSLVESALTDVFDSYDHRSNQHQINLSTATHNTNDAWRNSGGDLLLPIYFIMALGIPGFDLVVDHYETTYATWAEI